MVVKGGMMFGLGLIGLLVLGGCATPGERQAEQEQPPSTAGDGPPLEEQQEEAEGATAEGLGAAESAEGAALGADQEEAVTKPEEHRVFFEFDSSKLSDEARKRIRKHADYLQANPGIRVTLEGHADERGSREYNLGLGERRAKSVRRILLVNGISSERLEVVSFGEEKPLMEGSTEEAYARNRRVNLAYDRDRDEG
ncbi:peptidoglycan-associated lipoprotein Pal [Thiohalorhabdus sp.]|uniref:peptidoglycan-associated lipoprotein Pal n=1 Tax=Thiohalorhabdus sp. TaxID=3094134 RepID=UPI002FC2C7E8